MLKPTDLRIGNKLNYITAEGDVMETTIDWQDLKWLTDDPKGFNVCHKPIEITTQGLAELGLKYLQNACWKFGSMRIYNLSDETRSKYRIALAGHELTIIDYVHQLQNFYHSLTQTELCN